MKKSIYIISLYFISFLICGSLQAMEPEDPKLEQQAQKAMDPFFLAMQAKVAADKKPVKDVAKIKSVIIRNNGVVYEKKDDNYYYVCPHKGCLFKTNYEARLETHTQCHYTLRYNPNRLVYHCSDCDYLTTIKRTYQDHLKATKHKSEKDY